MNITDKEIFDILGIEEENRESSTYLLAQFRQLAENNNPNTIWLKGDYAPGRWTSYQTEDLVVIEEDEHFFDRLTNRIIFNDEDMIGYSWDIANYVRYSVKHDVDRDDEGEMELSNYLLEELAKHDDLVYCSYHPMGSWTVYELVMKGE